MRSFLLLFALPSLGLVVAQNATGNWIRSFQCNSLREFFNATKMDSNVSRSRHNWFVNNTCGEYCKYTGVTCDGSGQYVKSIMLDQKGLAGTLPLINGFPKLLNLKARNGSIGGQIPSESLASLSHLEFLDLGSNVFTGTLPDFSNFSGRLTHLLLDRNAFSGSILNTICDLQALSVLDLSRNTKLWGTLPECVGSNMSSLIELRITNIGLTGTIPSGLCSVRDMNDLTPNTYGCDVIGCAAGYFQRTGKRYGRDRVACEKCRVPSNVIASTLCEWQYAYLSYEDQNTSHAPAYVRVPSASPSYRSLFPNYPTTNSLVPSQLPSSPPGSGMTGTSSHNNDNRKMSIIASTIVAASFVSLLGVLFVFAIRRSRRQANGNNVQEVFDIEQASSDNLFVFGSSIMFPETSSSSGHVSKSYENHSVHLTTPSETFTPKPDPTRRAIPLIESGSIQNSSLTALPVAFPVADGEPEQSDDLFQVSPTRQTSILRKPNETRISLTKRVRFDLPAVDPWSLELEENETDETGQNALPQQRLSSYNVSSWITTPLYNCAAVPICTSFSIRRDDESSEDASSSSSHSTTEMCSLSEQSAEFYRCMRTSSRVDEAERLGINDAVPSTERIDDDDAIAPRNRTLAATAQKTSATAIVRQDRSLFINSDDEGSIRTYDGNDVMPNSNLVEI
jgi:hypothetical protein